MVDANDQLIECELDGGNYYIGMSWNEYGALWTMSVRDLNKQLLVSSIAVVPNFPLLRQVRRPEMPPGEFFVGAAADKALDRQSFLDNSAALIYFDATDIAALSIGG